MQFKCKFWIQSQDTPNPPAFGVHEQGGQPVRIPDPNPPPLQNPPKFSNPSFSNLSFWGKGSGPKAAKGAENFFSTFLRGFFSPYVSILEILRILWRIQKYLKDTENLLTLA